MPYQKLKDVGLTTRSNIVGKTISNRRRRREISQAENLMNSPIKNASHSRVVVAKRNRPRKITRKVRT